MTGAPDGSHQNVLLASLPEADRRRFSDHLEPVYCERGAVIVEPGDTLEIIHFPTTAVLSAVLDMEEGPTIEIGTIGNEGMTGIMVFLGDTVTPHRIFPQVPGGALEMPMEFFRNEIAGNGPLRRAVTKYTRAFLFTLAQQVACNRLHTVEERCSRWLLMTRDRVDSDILPLTHDFLAQMLGVRRASVSVAANLLQRAGMIEYRRGSIRILNREALEDSACECYHRIRREYERLSD